MPTMSCSTEDRSPFVGRIEELHRFEEVLKETSAQAIVVVGPIGMGKSMLLQRMARCAETHPNLQCGMAIYKVTSRESVETTMARMMNYDFRAAQVAAGSLDPTPRRLKQWRALFKLLPEGERLVELAESLRRDPQNLARDQLLERLKI